MRYVKPHQLLDLPPFSLDLYGIIDQGYKADECARHIGGIPAPDSTPENALQTYSGTLEED
jgi:hypothetical protein